MGENCGNPEQEREKAVRAWVIKVAKTKIKWNALCNKDDEGKSDVSCRGQW